MLPRGHNKYPSHRFVNGTLPKKRKAAYDSPIQHIQTSRLETFLASWCAHSLASFCSTTTWHALVQLNRAIYHTTVPFLWSTRCWNWGSEEASHFPTHVLPYVRTIMMTECVDYIPVSVRVIKCQLSTCLSLQRAIFRRLALVPNLETLLLFGPCETNSQHLTMDVASTTVIPFSNTLTKVHIYGHVIWNDQTYLLFPCLRNLLLNSIWVYPGTPSECVKLPAQLVKLHITVVGLCFPSSLLLTCCCLTSLHLTHVQVPLSGYWLPRSLRILRIHSLAARFTKTDDLPELIVFSLCNYNGPTATDWYLPNSIRYLRLPFCFGSVSGIHPPFKELRVLKSCPSYLQPAFLRHCVRLEQVIVSSVETVTLSLDPSDLPPSVKQIRFKSSWRILVQESIWQVVRADLSVVREYDGPSFLPRVDPEPKNKYKRVYIQWLSEQ